MAKQKRPFVPVVAFLNMKGGVGKSTLCANLALAIFEYHKLGTLLIDLDPQFNLTQGLFKREAYDQLKSKGNTIFSVMEPPSDVGLFDVATTSQAPPKAADVGDSLFYLTDKPDEELIIIPGDFQLVKYSLMDDNKKLMSVRSRFIKFVNQEKRNFKVICIDRNPSSSFLTLCALHVATHIVVPVRPDRFSMLGLEILSQFIESLPTLSPKPHLLILLNGIRRGGRDPVATAVEAELRAHPKFAARTLGGTIAETNVLKARTDYTGFAADRKVAWKEKLLAEISVVTDELVKKLGLGK